MTSSLLVHLIDEEISWSVSTVKKVVVVLLQRIPFLLCYPQTVASKLILQFLPLDLHCSIVPLCIEGSLFNYLMNNALSCILKNNRNFFLGRIKFLQRLFFLWQLNFLMQQLFGRLYLYLLIHFTKTLNHLLLVIFTLFGLTRQKRTDRFGR